MYKKSTYCKVSGGTTILKSQLKNCDIWNGQGTKSDVKKDLYIESESEQTLPVMCFFVFNFVTNFSFDYLKCNVYLTEPYSKIGL